VTVVWKEKRDVLAVGLAVTAYLGSQEGTETGHAMVAEPIPFLGFGCLQWHRGAEGRLRDTCKFAISNRKGNTTGFHIYRSHDGNLGIKDRVSSFQVYKVQAIQ
jgi:hypothetical protein